MMERKESSNDGTELGLSLYQTTNSATQSHHLNPSWTCFSGGVTECMARGRNERIVKWLTRPERKLIGSNP